MNKNMNESTGRRGLKIAMIAVGISAIIALIILTIMGVDIPKWLFLGLFGGGGLLIIYSFFIGIPSREARRYVDEKGRFDMTTPRSYTAKKVSAIQSYLGSGSPFKRNRIEQFDYEDGRVHIRMANGSEMSAPLAEMEMIVRKDPKGQGPTGYELHHGDRKINIVHNTAAFEDLEVEDMTNILMRCSAVREPKSLKILGGINKLIGATSDNLSDSGDDNLLDTLAEDKLSSIASSANTIEYIGGDNESNVAMAPKKRKKSRIKKFLFWTMGVLATLIVAFIVWALVSPDPEIEDWDETQPGYLAGAVDDDIMVIRVKMTKDITLSDNSLTAYTLLYGEQVQGLSYIAEDGGPYTYSFVAEGSPDQKIELEYESDDNNKILLIGTITEPNGIKKEAKFGLFQPSANEDYYLGTLAGQEALFMMKFDPSDGSIVSGQLFAGSLDISLRGKIVGRDEYGDPAYKITSPENADFVMEVSFWSNGGENGFYGEATLEGDSAPVRGECITTY